MQSSTEIITTNKPTSSFFTDWMPFLLPNQQCQSTEVKNITFRELAYPKLTWGLRTLSLTTNSSWLPWGWLHASHQPSDASTPGVSEGLTEEKKNDFYRPADLSISQPTVSKY